MCASLWRARSAKRRADGSLLFLVIRKRNAPISHRNLTAPQHPPCRKYHTHSTEISPERERERDAGRVARGAERVRRPAAHTRSRLTEIRGSASVRRERERARARARARAREPQTYLTEKMTFRLSRTPLFEASVLDSCGSLSHASFRTCSLGFLQKGSSRETREDPDHRNILLLFFFPSSWL